jgi:[ribosomal protein S18]-alanine N-acetyltransferase
MNEPAVIAPATIADVPAIHTIEQQCFPEPWRLEFFRSEIGAEGRFNLVVRRGGRIIGYLFAMSIFDEMHVNKIAVIEEERRKGIADTLMDRCFEFAHEHEITRISLEVRRSNEVAQQFYRHLDFVASYIRPRYYPDGESAVVMVREV